MANRGGTPNRKHKVSSIFCRRKWGWSLAESRDSVSTEPVREAGMSCHSGDITFSPGKAGSPLDAGEP
jgi:hypothetical protein